ncbi:MAG TPA: hypothetical protein VMW55_08625 [Nitrosopumilaceae archaeon]|jgi:hypothetical protein|nr:hypothetical protein [Nitrosopumilaceae archaeon]
MTHLSNVCSYCFNDREITAEKTPWLIHLAQHREDIIKHLTDSSSSCIFCAYPVEFVNKEQAASHYRWAHKKSVVINWALENMENTNSHLEDKRRCIAQF